MNVFLWLAISAIVGSLVGWIGSVAVRADGPHRVPLNLLVGALGGMLGARCFSADFGTSLVNRGSIPLSGIAAACVGALVSVSIVMFFWRGRRT
jgi:uncharacterized membrane protein YeaQ/YmgE (transglycosylase-associated protein family)